MSAGQAFLHAEPVVTVCDRTILWHLRIYDAPAGFERRLPYSAICTVCVLGADAKISGLQGRFDRATWRALEAWLRGQGCTSVIIERRGRVRVLM